MANGTIPVGSPTNFGGRGVYNLGGGEIRRCGDRTTPAYGPQPGGGWVAKLNPVPLSGGGMGGGGGIGGGMDGGLPSGHPYYWPKDGEEDNQDSVNLLDLLKGVISLPFKLLGMGGGGGDVRDPYDPREMALGDLAATRSLKQRQAGWSPEKLTRYRQHKEAQSKALYGPPVTPTRSNP